jgi:hypothetical protein
MAKPKDPFLFFSGAAGGNSIAQRQTQPAVSISPNGSRTAPLKNKKIWRVVTVLQTGHPYGVLSSAEQQR